MESSLINSEQEETKINYELPKFKCDVQCINNAFARE